jgi:hypothetical protein
MVFVTLYLFIIDCFKSFFLFEDDFFESKVSY